MLLSSSGCPNHVLSFSCTFAFPALNFPVSSWSHFDEQILEGETGIKDFFSTFGEKDDDCWLCGCFISQALDSQGTIVSTLACR